VGLIQVVREPFALVVILTGRGGMVDAVKVVTGSAAGEIGVEDGGMDMDRTRGSAEGIAEVVRLDNIVHTLVI
jgi:hypothetical protein